MMDFLAFALAFAGFSTIAMGMEGHGRQVFGRVPEEGRRRLLKLAGWVLLLLSLVPALAARGPSIGTVLWLSLLTAAGFIVGLMLSYRPRPLRVVGPALLALAVAVWALAGR
ncbi:DUF3325 domain-containing protein [Pseudothauera rhizosphaerae]|uniref:DUF3325 domain-containing protein n=1 Tax=Pseudothauera rhizosphaerae TaxID=2565932 RepID=A0A4S4AMC6_9RHOO|nr:DUF3325 domain-containing protein [Pseudothauera rhizosphaerae]THF60728.1 DUF3325 domain-containing protein [Pseudothauera rhizosphaerae]